MAQAWDTSGDPKPTSGVDNADTWMSALLDGIDAAASRYSGTSDPSSGAGWGATQVGREWLDITDPYNPVLKEWIRFDTGGSDYAWRPVKVHRVHLTTTDPAVTMPFASPAAADVGWTTLSLATLIGTHQDATFQLAKAVLVELYVTVTAGASEVLTNAAKGYLAFRKKGSTQEHAVFAQVAGRPTTAIVRVPVDSAEDLETKVVVGTGTPSFAFSVALRAIHESAGG